MKSVWVGWVLLAMGCAGVPPRDQAPVERTDFASAAWKAVDAHDWDRGRALAQECVTKWPLDAHCEGALMTSYTRRALYSDALLVAVRSCLERMPNDTDCLWAWAMHDLKHGEAEHAKQTLARLQTLAPDQTDTFVLEAEVAVAAHDVPAACIAYRHACDREQLWACQRVKEACTP